MDPTTKTAEELEAASDKRKKDRAERAKAERPEALRLEDKYETELGERGVEFQIVDCTHVHGGFVVVKLGSDVVGWKKFQASDMTEEDANAFVRPAVVHPPKLSFLSSSRSIPR